MLDLILLILYGVLILMVVLVLLLTGERPTKTLAWLLVILFIPFMGVFIYLALGLNRRKYKFFRLKRTKAVERHFQRATRFLRELENIRQAHETEMGEFVKLAKLIARGSNFIPEADNQVKLLEDGPSTFESIFAEMEQARQFIHIQFYIVEEGELTERLLQICEQKCSEGVQVKLIYDGFGSLGISRRFLRRLHAAGVQTNSFMRLTFGRLGMRINYRNHRKIVVVDGRVGFTGGINISDKYIKGDPHLGRWHDMHLRIEGPAVNSLNAVFAADWYFVSGRDELLTEAYFPEVEGTGKTTVQIVASGPDTDQPGIMQQYFSILTEADDYLYIANSYIVPGEAILLALQTAALGGVDVRLLLPEKSDSRVVKWVVRSYFEPLLRAGVRIFLYRDGFLHSKIVVADDFIASVGTANLDIRSFEQNFEVNAVIYDQEVSRELKALFLKDCQKSKELDLAGFLQRPWSERLIEGLAKILSPLM